MKAVLYDKYGGPEVMSLREIAIPEPKPGEVLVKIMAAGINPVDYKVRNGSMKLIASGKFPRIPGSEIAGVVEKTSTNAVKFSPGDKVFAMLSMAGGAYAQFISVKEELLSIMPGDLGFEESAVIPLAGLTALQSLRDYGKLKRGMSVLINGASGGVGIYAVQIAKALGAGVTAVCSGKNAAFVSGLGADNIIDYQTWDFTLLDQKFDIVFDAVAKSSPSKTRAILKKGGTYVTTVPDPAVMIRQFFNFAFPQKAFGMLCKPGSTDLDILAEMASNGVLKPHIEKTYTLEQAAEVHEHIESERVRGKLVIKIEHDS